MLCRGRAACGVVCSCCRRVSYQFDQATLGRHLLIAAVHLLLILLVLVVLRGQSDLPLRDNVVLSLIVFG